MQPIQTSPDERGIPWALEPTANQRDSSKRLRGHPTWQGRQMEAHALHNLNWALSDRFSSSWLREINNWYSLRAAIGWRKASEFHLSTSTEPKYILDPLLPTSLHLPAHSRRKMGLWYSNGLHHLWCCTPSCYTINNSCTCRLCGERQPSKSHLLSCRTSPLARHIDITPVNVNKLSLVNVLYVILACQMYIFSYAM